MKTELRELLEQNRNINRGFRKLEVWKEAIELFVFVREKLKTLAGISFKVKAQIEDSILSVSSNISEGYSRRSLKENIQHLSIALGSLGENYSQIFALTNSGDIDVAWFKDYDSRHYSAENKLIKLNRTYVLKLKEKDGWKNDYILREIIENYGS
jgi:four helix bundle protein